MDTSGPTIDLNTRRLAEEALSADVSRDQLENFIFAGHIPLPKQLRFHAAARKCDNVTGPTKIGFGGARGPGKTVGTLAQVGADDCQRHPGLKWLLLRKVGKAAREGFEDILRNRFPQWIRFYNSSRSHLLFPNGSRIVIGHFNTENDIDGYLGLEYDGIILEEATQLSQQKTEAILTCLRTSDQSWRPRAYFTWNPGGVGHAYIRKLFVVPYRSGDEIDTRFIPGTVRDNPLVNPEYRKQLEQLTGWRRKAWLDGDMDIASGQFFTTWCHEAHVGKVPSPPAHWPVWAAMDYGFTHPTVVYLFTENDGTRYIVDEYWASKRLPGQNAIGIKAMFDRHQVPLSRLRAFVAGDDVFAHKGDEKGKTIADQYAEHGIILSRANSDRINGAAEVLRALGDPDNGIEPRLLISSRCTRLIDCLPSLQHDPHRPEDVLKIDVDENGNGGDDPYDTLRYGLMTRAAPQQSQPYAGGSRPQLKKYVYRRGPTKRRPRAQRRLELLSVNPASRSPYGTL